jgi:hypothetical protein
VRDPGRRVPPPAIHQPFVADRLIALDEASEETLHFRVRIDDWVEVLRPSDHHFASDNRLDPVVRETVARENPFSWKAQRDDLAPPRRIRLELRHDARTHEHDLVSARTGLSEWPPRLDLNDAVGHVVEQAREMGL